MCVNSANGNCISRPTSHNTVPLNGWRRQEDDKGRTSASFLKEEAGQYTRTRISWAGEHQASDGQETGRISGNAYPCGRRTVSGLADFVRWRNKHRGFIARHMAQYKKNLTYRRWLALVAWAYMPR